MFRDTTFGRRLLLAVDAKGYGSGDDQHQREVIVGLPEVLDTAARSAGLDRATWARQPGGDGELAVLPPGESELEPVVVDDFVWELNRALAEYNRRLRDSARLRLRLAVHHGVAVPAGEGFSGQGVVAVCRLVDSPPVRELLAGASAAHLAVIVSDRVFLDSVRQGHTSLQPQDFRTVTARNKEFVETAHLYLPGHDVHTVELSECDVEQAGRHRESAVTPSDSRVPTDNTGNQAVSVTVGAGTFKASKDIIFGQVIK